MPLTKTENVMNKQANFLLLAVVALFAASPDGALAAVHYVDLNSPDPTPPYSSWVTAATTIQQAVDAAAAGDEVVVTNGMYTTGGRAVYGTMTNRVAVDKPLALQSVNGPQFTVIDGANSTRCVYLTNAASLSGFTLTNGWTAGSGGGAWCESTGVVISNCVLAGNYSGDFSGGGGGANGGTLNNCALTGNFVVFSGGGAYGSTLNNCTLIGNSSGGMPGYGGGAFGSTLNNCALSGNSAALGGGVAGGILNNCKLINNSAVLAGGGALAIFDFNTYLGFP